MKGLRAARAPGESRLDPARCRGANGCPRLTIRRRRNAKETRRAAIPTDWSRRGRSLPAFRQWPRLPVGHRNTCPPYETSRLWVVPWPSRVQSQLPDGILDRLNELVSRDLVSSSEVASGELPESAGGVE